MGNKRKKSSKKRRQKRKFLKEAWNFGLQLYAYLQIGQESIEMIEFYIQMLFRN